MALRLTPLRGLLWCAPHLGCARRLLLLQNSLSRRQVITGVFVDTAIQTSNSQRDIQIEREMELKDSFLKSLKDFFEALDTDGSGSIHLEEIKIMLQDRLARCSCVLILLFPGSVHVIAHGYILVRGCFGGQGFLGRLCEHSSIVAFWNDHATLER